MYDIYIICIYVHTNVLHCHVHYSYRIIIKIEPNEGVLAYVCNLPYLYLITIVCTFYMCTTLYMQLP